MIRFSNDYNHGAHPEILLALARTNDNAYEGYGLDEVCVSAADKIRSLVGDTGAGVHFFVGGTQVNYIALETMMMRPYESVIAADTGHISVHESGAIENTGHKVHQLPAVHGKITAEQIKKEAAFYAESYLVEHITHPSCVYISYPTEYGTVYSLSELEDIRRVCDEYGLYLFIDGARLGYGLASPDCDLTIEDIFRIADVFYIGGTKCGALFGEALVIRTHELEDHIRNYMKMNGALLAKGWLLGLQFDTLLGSASGNPDDCLYFNITKSAVKKAVRIQQALDAAGFEPFIRSQSNQLFYILPKPAVEVLSQNFIFEVFSWLDEDGNEISTEPDSYDACAVVRFCTSWSTTDEEADALVNAIKDL